MAEKQKSWNDHVSLKRVGGLIEVEKARKFKSILINHDKSMQSWLDDLISEQVASPGKLISDDSAKLRE